MAVATPSKPKPARRGAYAQRPVSGGRFELWTWYFMRLSGIVLVFLVLGHFTIVHLIDTGVDRVDFAFVSGRWSSPFWKIYDGSMLVLGLLHGTNGMRVIVDDYVRPSRRTAVKWVVYVASFSMLVLGILIVTSFDPNRGTSAVIDTLRGR